MNDELNKEGASDSLEDEPASLRVENEVNDDNKVDTSSEEEVVSKKKNKMAINYGILSSILIISSILTFFVKKCLIQAAYCETFVITCIFLSKSKCFSVAFIRLRETVTSWRHPTAPSDSSGD